VPEASKKQTREPFLASERQIDAPKTTANKYNSTGKSVALSEKSASSYQ
jgi:hypothetical protein